jgi:hypothetical protein
LFLVSTKSSHYPKLNNNLKLILKLDTNGKITTQLYDKWDDFNFSIVNFPYLCSTIQVSPAYCVYISQLIWYARAFSTYNQFLVRGNLLIDDVTGVSTVSFTGSCPQILWSLQRSYLPIQPFYFGHILSDMFHTNR